MLVVQELKTRVDVLLPSAHYTTISYQWIAARLLNPLLYLALPGFDREEAIKTQHKTTLNVHPLGNDGMTVYLTHATRARIVHVPPRNVNNYKGGAEPGALSAVVAQNETGLTTARCAIDDFDGRFAPSDEQSTARPALEPIKLKRDVLEGTLVPEKLLQERTEPLPLCGFDSLCDKLSVDDIPESELRLLVEDMKKCVGAVKETLQKTELHRDDEQVESILHLLVSISEEIIPLAKVPDLSSTIERLNKETVLPLQQRYEESKAARSTIDPLANPEAYCEEDNNCFSARDKMIKDHSILDGIHKYAEENLHFKGVNKNLHEDLEHTTSAALQSLEAEHSIDTVDITCIENGCVELGKELESVITDLSKRKMALLKRREKGEKDVQIMELLMAALLKKHRDQVEENKHDTKEIDLIDSHITPETGTLHAEQSSKLEVAEARIKQLSIRNEDCTWRMEAWKTVQKASTFLQSCEQIMKTRADEYFSAHQTELNHLREQLLMLLEELTVKQSDCNHQLTLLKEKVASEENKQLQCIKTSHRISDKQREGLASKKEDVRKMEELRDHLTDKIGFLQDYHTQLMVDALKGEKKEVCGSSSNEPAPKMTDLEVHTKSGTHHWKNAVEVMGIVSATRSFNLLKEELERDKVKMEEKQREIKRLTEYLESQARQQPLFLPGSGLE
ncbi:hypothetical protein Pelo_15199 [Pelomyxa schiedti]|nr:hypothetical protein Pelo_15199 [Pelomyxa schiedti]